MSELAIKKPVGLLAAATSSAVALSAVAGCIASLIAATPFWYLAGFEIVTLVAAVFGLLLALGRFPAGPGLALLCVAGAIAAGALLGDLSTNKGNPLGGPVLRQLGAGGLVQISINAFVVARLVAAAVLALCAAWVVLHRRPAQSMRSLVWGLALGALTLAVVFAAWKARAPLSAVDPFLRTIAMLTAGALALGLLAAATHFTIQAFEFGRLSPADPNPTPKP